jgi:hypothetical protein
MKKQIEIKPNVPNKNGIIYTEKCLEEAFKKFMDSKIVRYVTTGPPDSDGLFVDMRNVIARVDGIEKIDNKYIADCNVLFKREIHELLLDNLELKVAAVGIVDEKNIVNEMNILCLYVESNV